MAHVNVPKNQKLFEDRVILSPEQQKQEIAKRKEQEALSKKQSDGKLQKDVTAGE